MTTSFPPTEESQSFIHQGQIPGSTHLVATGAERMVSQSFIHQGQIPGKWADVQYTLHDLIGLNPLFIKVKFRVSSLKLVGLPRLEVSILYSSRSNSGGMIVAQTYVLFLNSLNPLFIKVKFRANLT